MALRQRVRAASASASQHFGRKPAPDDPLAISFWLCEGHKKKTVRAKKSASLETALLEWDMLSVLDDADLHFLNEATGVVVPRTDAIGQYISDRDVVRMCASDELALLLDKFATRDADVDADIMGSHKPNSSLGAALGKLRKIGNSSTTLKRIQKTLDDLQSPLADDNTDVPDRFPETDPVFESSDTEELPATTPPKCDMCDVSWPDDATSRMHRVTRLGLITHEGCAQFAADVLTQRPDIKSRTQVVDAAPLAQVNQPGTFYVTVLRAMDLPGVQLLGTQAPYAKLSLLPWQEPIQTKAVEMGGRNPIWLRNHDRTMQFAHMYNSTITPIPLLEVEIWNSNFLSDDLVACTLVDMTPLLRFPRVEAKRWFTLSSRVQAPLALMSPSTGQAKVLLAITFVPLDGKYTDGNEHKFRVHQLKSIGLAIPNCAVCDRVIVNVMKGAWGYRCEYCSIDVHKACIMKAMTSCECKRSTADTTTNTSTSSSATDRVTTRVIERRGVAFRVLSSTSSSSNSALSRVVGQLFVNFQGLHLCTKQCHVDVNVHAKNIFDGDTYCRLLFDDAVHETSPVLRSADPMFHEAVCFESRFRNATFRVEVVDFNSDAVIGEMALTLFQLLQRDADRFVRSDPTMNRLRAPLRQLARVSGGSSVAAAATCDSDVWVDLLRSHDRDRYDLVAPGSAAAGSDKRKLIGYALLRAEYVESKDDLLRIRLDEDDLLLEDRALDDVTVESLRATVDRFARVVRTFQWLALAYDNVISWKDTRTSIVWLVVFVICCVGVDLEHVGAYVLGSVLLYMLYTLHLRLEGAFVRRWIGFSDYDAEQTDALKLHRPLADLRVAVVDATLTTATAELMRTSQSAALTDAAAAKLGVYVRIKYLPNDHRRSVATTGGTARPRFIPSGYDETVVAWTHAVEKSQHPVWRHAALLESTPSAATTTTTFSAPFVSKPKKEAPFRNFNISWRHDAATCACVRCAAVRTGADDRTASGGVDHHAFYFPVPQAMRKNFTNRVDLVPWRLFPGALVLELCASLSGDAKETPDVVVATSTIALRDVQALAGPDNEVVLPLTLTPSVLGVEPLEPPTSDSVDASLPTVSQADALRVRISFQVPSTSLVVASTAVKSSTASASTSALAASSSTDELMRTHTLLGVSRAERRVSELVCASLVAAPKESSAVLGSHLLDAFWKIKDTLRQVQTTISTACGTLASIEHLLNWTHPWKTATAFAVVSVAAAVCAVVPGRWLVLAFGLSEFAAGFIEDLPPSNHVRNVAWNFVTSVPTDQDLLDVYAAERDVYATRQRARQERDDEAALRLRHHALFVGAVQSKGESERSYKSYFLAYRSFRFVLWKSVEDAESGAAPHHQLIIERAEAIVNKIDDSSFVFHAFGVTASGSEEKRSFMFESLETKELLMQIVHRSCETLSS